ncbi:MAG: TerD domain-containing protein [Selenomonadaceae bacterium]|nr:TerD domain-containing protein [Selenomonadaceae bacterium]
MAIKLSKGQKIDLTKNNPLLNRVMIGLGWQAGQGLDLDTAAFLLRADGKVDSDEDFVFYGNLRHKSGAVTHSGDNTSGGTGDVEQIHIDLSLVPNDVEKIDFTATIYDAKTRRQNFGMVKDAYIRVVDESSGQELVRFNLGDQFSVETAIVVGEVYRHKGNWKFNAIGAGFSGGLAALCKNFGVDVSEDDSAARHEPPPPPPTPKPPVQTKRSGSTSTKRSGPLNMGRGASGASSAPPPPVADPIVEDAPKPKLKKIELKKGQKVNLVKSDKGFGEIVINLNWSQPSQRPSTGLFDRIFGSSNRGIDLDLGCLYELKDGSKGAIQALGNNFGSLAAAPYIALDGDDRTGAVSGGETIRVNGKFADKIKRILVYTFIYEGIANWREADGIVTVKCSGSPDIIVRMDEYGSDKSLCGIALIENTGSTFSVEKVVDFFDSQRYLDEAFNWGLRWSAGRK